MLLLTGCYDDGSPASAPSRPAQSIEAFRAAEDALKSGLLEDALVQAELAAQADPSFDEAVWLQASLLGRSGRLEEALVVCRKLVARSPDFVQAQLLEGILHDQLGDQPEANRCYDEVLRRYAPVEDDASLDIRSQLLRALVIYLRKGELEGIRALNQFLADFPGHPTALYLKGCMQTKERGFLLRWFSEPDAEVQALPGPGETVTGPHDSNTSALPANG